MSCLVTFKSGSSFSAVSLSLIRCKISFRGSPGVSTANPSHWRVLIYCSLMSLSVALSGGNLSVCAEAYLSGPFISSSFSCQVFTLTGSHLFHWQSAWAERLLLSLSSSFSTFPAFARLSLPASLVPSSYRQSGSAVKQDLCRLLCSACLHNC